MADLTTGLSTDAVLDAPTPYLRLNWIAWDSPFRGSGLCIGDRIVAVNGQPFAPAATRSALIGQYAESQGLELLGLGVGQPLTLRVRRRAQAAGWNEIELSAPLAERRYYRDASNSEVLGPGGPLTMQSGDFSSGGWGSWYEQLQLVLTRLLGYERQTCTFVSRVEAQLLREAHDARVAFARANYPGPWSVALGADYDAALAICDGRVVTLAPNALDFRRRGEQLAADVSAAAQAAWSAFQASHAVDIIPAFPAVHPVRDDVSGVAGKLVLLPALANRDWISDSGHGWFAAGADGWYFLDAEGEAVQAMLMAQQRYARLVDPNLPARWEFIARVSGDARLVVVNGGAYFGLVAEPLAVLVGGAMFIDLGQRNGTLAAFAGEAGLLDQAPPLPPPHATPAEVLTALVGAVKGNDVALWSALHADWWLEYRDAGDGMRTIVHPYAAPPDAAMFELSRRSLMGRVLDAQVVWTGDPQTVVDGKRFPGASAIEEVEVWLDHIGRADGSDGNGGSGGNDGAPVLTRSFVDVTVNARWRLQRVDGGAWRVVQAQPI